MRVVLFDLGNTLEHQGDLVPGARDMLEAVTALEGPGGEKAVLGLVSDFDMPADAADRAEIAAIRADYFTILDGLGIRPFFEPVDDRVTLSTDVGVFKPDPRIFRAALDRLAPGLEFADALFVTENKGHVLKARELGMRAAHFKVPGQSTGDIDDLADLVPLVQAHLDGPT
jgi:FMN phosphatase YigB (HAD superfamily)